MIAALLAGLGFGLSLIVAVGPQNAYVLRQGALRDHVGLVVLLCAASDTVLITAGVGGMGSAIQAVPWLVELMRWLGAAVVLGYGVLAATRAMRGSGALPVADDGAAAGPAGTARPAETPAGGPTRLALRAVPGRRTAVAATALALTWLNPHVYLDTLVLMGGIGSTYGDLRWWFAVGAVCASWAWFAAIGFGAARLSGVLARPVAWRVLDGVIAVIMLTVAVGLILG
ncbi:LysE/ArgO family amino acid transporter [Myceligenerans pegani]|uniref:Amino acid transporter n=1 Tax=Myceligenerans pegani TaxID=2776917 RepID=A0ABR9N032_9MICO|nr:LysE/ArgO family amino acid transporter [Myceligenerans sp. TRM 65318]MBE1876519.1 amino acid transporter [Myceligenerans sp. TRM 65318]MBE3018790.1 amino acid transporter [Myceligenerans sp. TRM 65318]